MKIVNPDKIFNDFKSGRIDSSSAIESLLVNLQKTDDHTKKVQYIELFSEIYRDFKPENEEFEDKLINLIKSVIRNENYVYVLYRFVDAVKQIEKSFKELVMAEVIKKYVLFYDIPPEEAKFLIDLDYLDPTYSYTRKKIQFAERYKNKIVTNRRGEFRGFYYLINQNHIIGVNFRKNINEIPNSIQGLENLKYLHIYVRKNNFSIPEFLESLTKLKELIIFSGYPIEIPEKVKDRVHKHNIKKFLNDGVCMEDALLLANLEFIDWRLYNIENDPIYEEDPEWYNLGDVNLRDYRLDKNGNVIEIYIRPWNQSSLVFFPKELCFFKNLKVLVLQFYELKSIPESIINLEKLKKLDIINLENVTIKIPDSIRPFLESLESFEIDGKEIYH